MRLPQLYKVFQDTNTTDELMLFIPAISSTIFRAPSPNVPLHDGDYIFADRTQGPFRK